MLPLPSRSCPSSTTAATTTSSSASASSPAPPARRPRSHDVIVISSDDDDPHAGGGGTSSSSVDCSVAGVAGSSTRPRRCEATSAAADSQGAALPYASCSSSSHGAGTAAAAAAALCGGMYLTTVEVSCSVALASRALPTFALLAPQLHASPAGRRPGTSICFLSFPNKRAAASSLELIALPSPLTRHQPFFFDSSHPPHDAARARSTPKTTTLSP